MLVRLFVKLGIWILIVRLGTRLKFVSRSGLITPINEGSVDASN